MIAATDHAGPLSEPGNAVYRHGGTQLTAITSEALLQALDATRLQSIVHQALESPAARILTWAATSAAGDRGRIGERTNGPGSAPVTVAGGGGRAGSGSWSVTAGTAGVAARL